MNPAWKLFFRGEVLTGSAPVHDLLPPAHWGVLIAPLHIQITTNGRRFRAKLRNAAPITGLQLNVQAASAATRLRVNFHYIVRSYNLHQVRRQ